MNKPELGSCFFILLGWRACPVWGLKGPWDITLGACAQGLQRGWGVSVRRGQGCPRPGTAGSGRFHSLACWVPQPHERHFRGMYLTKGETLPGHKEPLLPFPLSLLFYPPALPYKQVTLPSVLHFVLLFLSGRLCLQSRRRGPISTVQWERKSKLGTPGFTNSASGIFKQYLHFILKGDFNFLQHYPKTF